MSLNRDCTLFKYYLVRKYNHSQFLLVKKFDMQLIKKSLSGNDSAFIFESHEPNTLSSLEKANTNYSHIDK